MKTLGKISPILLLLGLLGLTIYFWYQSKHLPIVTHKETIYQTDTVYIRDTLDPIPPYSQDVKPKEILVYVTDTVEMIINDTTIISQPIFTDQDSLFQILLEASQLSLSMENTRTGIRTTRRYPINLEEYTYNWYQGKLSSEYIGKDFKIQPYAYAKYRIFNNLLDLGTGISFKTKKLNYNLGINAFSYPKFNRNIGIDLEVGIKYNF